jgi:hypothetical protein
MGIGDDIERLFDTVTTDRRDDAELGAVSVNRIDQAGQLANNVMARAMEHQSALLLGRSSDDWDRLYIGRWPVWPSVSSSRDHDGT